MQTTPSGMEPWNLESLQLWGCKAGSMIFFSHKHYYWRNPRPVDEEPGQLAELYFMIVWIPMLCRFTAPHMRHMCFAVWRGKMVRSRSPQTVPKTVRKHQLWAKKWLSMRNMRNVGGPVVVRPGGTGLPWKLWDTVDLASWGRSTDPEHRLVKAEQKSQRSHVQIRQQGSSRIQIDNLSRLAEHNGAEFSTWMLFWRSTTTNIKSILNYWMRVSTRRHVRFLTWAVASSSLPQMTVLTMALVGDPDLAHFDPHQQPASLNPRTIQRTFPYKTSQN
jgi:hypothetical protein